MTEVLPASPEAVERAARLLRDGQVVAIPTETVYGLAGSAFDEAALTRIFEVKERPTFDPLIVHVAVPGPEEGTGGVPASGAPASGGIPASLLLDEFGLLDRKALGPAGCGVVDRLADGFWPGPLTLVLPKQPGVPDLATSGLPTVAVRMPAHPVARAILLAAGTPLAAPSANRFGRISPTIAGHVVEELGGRIPLVVDGGPCGIGVESTVLQVLPDGSTRLLRPGGIPVEAISELLGAVPLSRPDPARPGAARPEPARSEPARPDPAGESPVPSPGLLASHYAPARPLVLLSAPLDDVGDEDILALSASLDDVKDEGHAAVGLLLQEGGAEESRRAARRVGELLDRPVETRILSPTGALDEAARRLFGVLRELDSLEGVGVILAEPPRSRTGLAHAIADRLARAAAGSPQEAAPGEKQG